MIREFDGSVVSSRTAGLGVMFRFEDYCYCSSRYDYVFVYVLNLARYHKDDVVLNIEYVKEENGALTSQKKP